MLYNLQNIMINEEQTDQRIDNFLYNLFDKKVARSFIYSIIRTGQVRVNSGRIKPKYSLNLNDKVRIPPIKSVSENSEKIIVNKKTNTRLLEFWQNKISKSIIFEDQNLLVINKPCKLAVHGGSNVSIGLIEILRNLRPKEHFLELVHRIDQDTSGCLMIAKKRSYLKQLHCLLREQKINKTYAVIVIGLFDSKKIVELPLKKIIKSSKEHFVKPSSDGGYAKTEFIPDQIFKINDNQEQYSLITAKPKTGKTHQIRVHLAHIGFPIINDDKYGKKINSDLAELRSVKRMLLHAKHLKFICPKTHKTIEVSAEYDAEFMKFFSAMEQVSG
jgi:23S rRNA pseudouridine955/2504/2580 synthase